MSSLQIELKTSLGASPRSKIVELPQFIGKRGRVLYEAHHRQVNTWVSNADYELLVRLAAKHKIKLSVFLRAIIVDALQDERVLAQKKRVV